MLTTQSRPSKTARIVKVNSDVVVEALWRFSVEDPEPIGQPIISVNEIDFDYDKGKNKEIGRFG